MIKAVGGFWGCPDGIRPSKCRFDQTFSYLLQRRCCFLSFFIIMQVSRLCPKLASSTGVYSAKRTAASPDRGVQPQIIWQRCQHLDHYQSVLCIIIVGAGVSLSVPASSSLSNITFVILPSLLLELKILAYCDHSFTINNILGSTHFISKS